ncbi:MAG: acyl-CoA dehydrogenase family protein [Gammaproteobacteria bacterium]|nr:acyl-CoA dehydrogenase family protein [Gammaproteobacteria bacterium]
MEFGYTDEELAFRERVREFLVNNPPETFSVDGMDGGYGSGPHSRAFMRALGAEGFIDLTWPEQFGGAGRPFFLKLVLLEELAAAGAPFGPLGGLDQASDAFMKYGSSSLQQALLPRCARGEVVFWQGFSEPNAGSDLLSLTTEAVRDGDEWVINGHKIWSSHAGICDFGLVLARTDGAARRHHGISMFVVANDLPGVDIRPIVSLTGEVYHYEVFLDDVRVDQDYLLGGENRGFTQLLKGLDSDRFWGRFYKAPALKRLLDQLVDYANHHEHGGMRLSHDGEVRRRFARLAVDIQVLHTLFWRLGWMIKTGVPTPFETALYKVYADETGQKLAAFGMELLGAYGPLAAGSRWEALDGRIRHFYLTSMGQTIAGGTSEVLRTTVATRGLGLPRAGR